MRILITGFGPFLGVTDNPSERIVSRFAAEPAGMDLTTCVLPVSFGRAEQLLADLLLGGVPPDVALLLGVAGRERELRLERFARNRTSSNLADVDGFSPGDAVIREGGPGFYETKVDISALLKLVRADSIPARISKDAGGYVCNYVYFHALRIIHINALPTRCLFVHVPGDVAAFPVDRQFAAVESILAFLTAC